MTFPIESSTMLHMWTCGALNPTRLVVPLRVPTVHSPGARANMATDSPVEASAVTRERRRSKYWDKIVTVGRKVRQ